MWQKVSQLPRQSVLIQASVLMRKKKHLVSSEMPSAAILHKTGIRGAQMPKGRPMSLEAGDQG